MNGSIVSCQVCCKNFGKLINSHFPWLPQVDIHEVAVICAKCERDYEVGRVEKENERVQETD